MITIESQDKKVFGNFETVFLDKGIVYSYANSYKNRVTLGKYAEERAVEVFTELKLFMQNGCVYDTMDGKTRTVKCHIYSMPIN